MCEEGGQLGVGEKAQPCRTARAASMADAGAAQTGPVPSLGTHE